MDWFRDLVDSFYRSIFGEEKESSQDSIWIEAEARIAQKERLAGVQALIERERRDREADDYRARCLSELGMRFKCTVCGVSSQYPDTKDSGCNCAVSDIDCNGSCSYDDWDTPGDLTECSKCHGWVHNNGSCSRTLDTIGFRCRNCALDF